MLSNWTKYLKTRKRDLSSNNDKPTTLKARMKKIEIYLRQVDFGQTWSCWAHPPFRSSSLPSDDCLTPISLSSEELHLEKISLKLWEYLSECFRQCDQDQTVVSARIILPRFFLTSASPLSCYWSNQDISFYKMILYLCYRMWLLHSVFGYLCWKYKYETPITCS